MTRRFSRGFSPSRNPLKIRASLGRTPGFNVAGAPGRNPLKIRASLGLVGRLTCSRMIGRNPLKIRASLGHHLHPAKGRGGQSQSLKDQGKSRTITMDDIEDYFGESQSLKDQGKSRTIA